jgi:hypothetical protein
MTKDVFDLTTARIPQHILRLVPSHIAKSEGVLPVACDGGVLTVAASDLDEDDLDEDDLERIDLLRFVSNRKIRVLSVPRVRLRFAIWRNYA